MLDQISPITDLMNKNLPPDYVLSSIYEVENALIFLEQVKKKIEYYKNLKKHRSKSIDTHLDYLENGAIRARQIILRTMQELEPDNKTFNFPSIGKVSRKKLPSSYTIDDEDQLLSYLESKGLKGQVVEMKEVVNAKKLKSLLDDLIHMQNGNIPGVSIKIGEETISITYESSEKSLPQQQKIDKLESLHINMDDL